MTSRERIDSVIDVYNNVSPELETFEKVVEERDELREQNKQLWKIIEKQRLIVHQLQKIVNSSPELKKKIKMESNGNKVPLLSRRKDSNSKNDIKKNEGENNSNQDNDNNLKEKVEGNETLEGSVTHINKPSLVEDLNFDNEISRAQKTQSIIDEKFQLKPLEDVATLDQEMHSNAITKNEDEWDGNENKLKGKMGLHKASSAPRLHIPSLKNNLQSSHMVSLDALSSKQDKELVSPQDSKSKLSIPPRSNLRNRGDPPIVKENEKKYLPTIAEKEEMLRLPNNRIPDLRKGKAKKADLNNDSSSEVNLSRDVREEKPDLIGNSQINNTSEVTSIEPMEKETVNKVHRSLSESSVRPPTALSQKSILKNNDEVSNIAENKKSHSKSTSLSSRFSNHRDSIPSVHSNLSGHDEAEDIYKTARTDPIDPENLGLEKEEMIENVKASNLSPDNQRPMIYIPSPPQAVPDTFDQNLNDGYSSSVASNDSDFDADAGFISNVSPEEESSRLAIRGSKIEVFSSTSKTSIPNENQEPDFNPNAVNGLNNYTNNNSSEPILHPLFHTDDETQKDIEVTELKEDSILQESQIPEITEIVESEPNSIGQSFNEGDPTLNLNQNVRSDIKRTRTSRSEEGFATFKEEIKLKKKQSASSLLLDDPKKLNQVLSTEKDVRNNHHINRGKVVNESEESSNNSSSLIEKTQNELEEITKEAILIQKQFKKIKLEVHTIDATSDNPTINLIVYGIPISCTTNDVNANFIQINRLEKTWKKMMLLDEMVKH
ncbi:hypothetical protein K502DRAFT_321812 [Neoconidiobolus thromboides FSU 785]|nr:hypothetical protein K502DRAFT_321812 [Neoconidiobolus thromboides FSU 785]